MIENRESTELPTRDLSPLIRLRRLQIRAVAIGTCGSLLLLTGLALKLPVITWIGLSGFTFALLAVIVLGITAWWKFE